MGFISFFLSLSLPLSLSRLARGLLLLVAEKWVLFLSLSLSLSFSGAWGQIVYFLCQIVVG